MDLVLAQLWGFSSFGVKLQVFSTVAWDKFSDGKLYGQIYKYLKLNVLVGQMRKLILWVIAMVRVMQPIHCKRQLFLISLQTCTTQPCSNVSGQTFLRLIHLAATCCYYIWSISQPGIQHCQMKPLFVSCLVSCACVSKSKWQSN